MNSACGVPAAEDRSDRFFLEHAHELAAIGQRIAAFDAAIAAALARRDQQTSRLVKTA